MLCKRFALKNRMVSVLTEQGMAKVYSEWRVDVMMREDMEDGQVGKSTRCINQMTRVWIPRTHKKLDVVVYMNVNTALL